jgi:RNA polymerase sigma-70 factor, ECF subfamily
MTDLHTRLKDELPRLIRYSAALTGDADEALDLVEDTILQALSSELPSAPDRLNVRVWLLTMLHDHRRNPFRRIAAPLDAPQSATDTVTLLRLPALQRAIGQLPEEQRAAILLVGLEGMSCRETSSVLRISVGAVSARLTWARENLWHTLGEVNAAVNGGLGGSAASVPRRGAERGGDEVVC